MFSKSQTATEYLVILGVVIAIAVITVGTVSDVISIGGGLNEQQIRLELATQPIAVTNYIVSDYDTKITLQNNFGELVKIESITINNEECLFFYGVEHRLNPGMSKDISCVNVYTLTEDEVEYTIEINYTDLRKGGTYSQSNTDLTLVGSVANTYYGLISTNTYWNESINGCYDNTTSPIPICTCADLDKVRYDLTSNHSLQNSIDFVRCNDEFGVDFTESNGGWDIICDSSDSCEYAGTFDGNNHIINNLHVEGTTDVGLFGDIHYLDAEFYNLGLINVFVNGTTYVGALVGDGRSGFARNVFVTGDVYGNGWHVGGLVGNGQSFDVAQVYSTANVWNSNVGRFTGGIVGYMFGGSVTDCYATGVINSTSSYVGGAFGSLGNGYGFNCYSTGDVYGTSYTGGIIGLGGGESRRLYATGDVYGTSNYVGALFGRNDNGEIYDSYALGRVRGGNYVGGIVGYGSNIQVYYSHSLSDIYAGSNAGGIAGYGRNAIIENSYAIAPNISSASLGGVVGTQGAGTVTSITNSYWVNWSNPSIGPSQCVQEDASFDGVGCFEVFSLTDIPENIGVR